MYIMFLKVDMWSVGCLLASQIFGIHPFFTAKTKYEMVTSVGDVLGRQGMVDFIKKYDFKVLNEVALEQ